MTFSTPGWVSGGAAAFDAIASLVTRSSRRAHLGGRLFDGKTQAMLARRQVEHGDCLSQRTFRLRQTMQLRNFGARGGPEDRVVADVDELAFFSEVEADVPTLAGMVTDAVTAGIFGMLDLASAYYHSSPQRNALSYLSRAAAGGCVTRKLSYLSLLPVREAAALLRQYLRHG